LHVTVGLVEQVDDLFVVNFKEGAVDDEVNSCFPLFLDALE
jgi:hypothetical protein